MYTFLAFAKNTIHTLSISNINSISHEYVYNPYNIDIKISELIWETSNSKLIGYKFTYISDKKNFFNINYKTLLQESSTVMNDYDWLDQNNPNTWSHHSYHPDTILDKLNIFDININILISPKNKLFFIIGYKKDSKKFKAYNGTYIYSSSGTKRDLTGNFSGLGITYIEKFKGIYYGLRTIKYIKSKTILESSFKYSKSFNCFVSDTHHFRKFTNTSNFKSIEMLNIDLTLKYNYKKNLFLNFKYNYNKYKKSIAYTTRRFFDGRTYYYPGSGTENEYNIISFEIEKLFEK